MQERLQKFLAHAGVASRRQGERLILEGRIRVNGQVVTQLGTRIDTETDSVKVDGKLIKAEKLVYILMNKPRGTICSLDDPGQRVRVTDLLKGVKARVYPVGRLDYDTSGALLLTNDGELTNHLTHPRHQVSRTYLAKVKGVPTSAQLEKLRKGVFIEGGKTAPAEAKVLAAKENTSLLSLVLREGRNRQVKLMCAAVGHPCMKLTRTAFGFLTVSDLPAGGWRYLENGEVKRLKFLAQKGTTEGRSHKPPRGKGETLVSRTA